MIDVDGGDGGVVVVGVIAVVVVAEVVLWETLLS